MLKVRLANPQNFKGKGVMPVIQFTDVILEGRN
jgi:hypothetical protein